MDVTQPVASCGKEANKQNSSGRGHAIAEDKLLFRLN